MHGISTIIVSSGPVVSICAVADALAAVAVVEAPSAAALLLLLEAEGLQVAALVQLGALQRLAQLLGGAGAGGGAPEHEGPCRGVEAAGGRVVRAALPGVLLQRVVLQRSGGAAAGERGGVAGHTAARTHTAKEITEIETAATVE